MSFPLPATSSSLRRTRRRTAVAFTFCFVAVAGLFGAESKSIPKDYRIAPRDLIQFQMFEEPDVAVAQRVTATGEIRLPMIGTVKIEGLTLREAEARLRESYIDEEFFVNPQVILSLQEYDERSVSVLGQVNKPDEIQLPLEAGTLSLIRAITLAGGLTRLAKSDAIQITRRNTEGGDQRIVVNLDAALANPNGHANSDFQLLPGDIVLVPERNF